MAAALLYQRPCNGGEETIANGWRVGLFRCPQPSDIDEAHAGGRLAVEVCGHRYGISDNFENAQDQMAELRCDRMSRTGRP
jgi:hypothetical protein